MTGAIRTNAHMCGHVARGLAWARVHVALLLRVPSPVASRHPLACGQAATITKCQ